MQVRLDGGITVCTQAQCFETVFADDLFQQNGDGLLGVFWADVDTTGTGNVYYHQSEPDSKQSVFDRINLIINMAFNQQQTQFSAKEFLIATWDEVGYFNSRVDRVKIL